MNYDLIGDIHGYARPLIALLDSLGYRRNGTAYRHPERIAVFLGDFIDHGPDSRQVLEIVRPMVEERAALAILGNHEFNAVCYHTPDGRGGFLRTHNGETGKKNRAQREATLASFGSDTTALLDHVEWFKGLPLWLEFPAFRVVHACWDAEAIATLKAKPTMGHLGPLNREILLGHEAEAMKLLCKGHEIPVEGLSYLDKSGHRRHELRVAWWRNAADKTCRQIAVKDEHLIPELPLPVEDQRRFPGYGPSEPLVFIGHYSLDVKPEPLLPNLVCVDLGVTSGRGLAAYRWQGEPEAAPCGFVVSRGA